MSRQTSFYELLAHDGLAIEIPMIQRDYAQGRHSAARIRAGFLEALYEYLREGRTGRDLDFVYGDVDEHRTFIPLDGQQRLTTLFLLHWFLALKDGAYQAFKAWMLPQDVLRFRYTTRQTATDFCQALVRYGADVGSVAAGSPEPYNPDDPKPPLSAAIRDCHWYFNAWNHDPTVQSMLTMLDAIHAAFDSATGFYDKLARKEGAIITFQFLELKKYALGDDLYIKMNSRGKALTPFETFKAQYERHLRLRGAQPKVAAGGQQATLADYFAHRIDTVWADFFWPFRDPAIATSDTQLMHFLATVAINHKASAAGAIPLKGNTSLKEDIDGQDTLPLAFFTGQDERFASFLINLLDVLSFNKTFTVHLPGNRHYNEQAAFEDIINKRFGDAAYHERILFYAYSAFLVQWGGDVTGFADWMRVAANLSEHTRPFYNNEDEYAKAVGALRRLLPHSRDVLAHLCTLRQIFGFYGPQVQEEIIKAHLIRRGAHWAALIYRLEEHPYFNGQITVVLAFAGVEDFYQKNHHCNWPAGDEDDAYLAAVQSYAGKVFPLFVAGDLCDEALHNHRLHRAVLAKGDYLIYAARNYSFLNGTHRDVSWKRFLLADDDDRKAKRQFFRRVIDDPHYQPAHLGSLEAIAAHIPTDAAPWRRTFLENPGAFDYLGGFKWVRMPDDDEDCVYLLRKTRTSAAHGELFTCARYLRLEAALDVAPFAVMEYKEVSGEWDEPHIMLHSPDPESGLPEARIQYAGQGQYTLRLRNTPAESIADLLTQGYTALPDDAFERTAPEDGLAAALRKMCEALAPVVAESSPA